MAAAESSLRAQLKQFSATRGAHFKQVLELQRESNNFAKRLDEDKKAVVEHVAVVRGACERVVTSHKSGLNAALEQGEFQLHSNRNRKLAASSGRHCASVRTRPVTLPCHAGSRQERRPTRCSSGAAAASTTRAIEHRKMPLQDMIKQLQSYTDKIQDELDAQPIG